MRISPLLSALVVCFAATGTAQQHPGPASRPAPQSFQSATQSITLATFAKTIQNSMGESIQGVAADSAGNLYVAGTTYSPSFPVKNAHQPAYADASILKTTDNGATWTGIAGPPGGALLLVADPVVSQILFAETATGIYKSVDGGQTWQLIYTGPISQTSSSTTFVIDPGNHLRLAAITRGAVVRSLDGGQTWSTGAPCQACGELVADPTGSGALLSLGGGAQISRDWGSTWQNFTPANGHGPVAAVAFDPSHAGWIYLDEATGVSGSLYLTTDYGATWTAKASLPTPFSAIQNMAVAPGNPSMLVAATPDGLYKSSDGGNSWTLQAGYPRSFLPDSPRPFVMVPQACGGGLIAVGDGLPIGSFSTGYSPDLGSMWTPSSLTHVLGIFPGAGCAVYATRTLTSDAFVAKLSPDGETQWATYLGGSDADATVALALDSAGNVYVVGTTTSPDFPATLPHIGVAGEQSVFFAKFAPDGSLAYSGTLGGEAGNAAVALAIDAAQNIYIAGTTGSSRFPVTPGTLGSGLPPGSGAGFLVKLSPDASLTYSTYLGPSDISPGSILVDASQQVTIAGVGVIPGMPNSSLSGPEFVMKLDASAAHVVQGAYIPGGAGSGAGVTAIAADSQGNLLLFGATYRGSIQASPGAFYSEPPVFLCSPSYLAVSGDAFVMKLNSAWQPTWSAVFGSSCNVATGNAIVDADGSILLAMSAAKGVRLAHPFLGAPAPAPVCPSNGAAVARLSADGSALQYGAYLPACGLPAIAAAQNGAVYAGVTQVGEGYTAVVKVPTANAAPISLDGVANAFSGDSTTLVAGGLYSLAVSGFQPPAANLGLQPAADLPTTLNGVQVLFDGVPGAVLATGPGQIIAAAPVSDPFSGELRTGNVYVNASPFSFASVQVIYNGVASNPVWMPILPSQPGLLTLDLLNPQYHLNYADAVALNADGSQNSVTNPATAGSTVTVFGTGVGLTLPVVAPGSIAGASPASPKRPLYAWWEPEAIVSQPPSLYAATLKGWVSAVSGIQVPVPFDHQSLRGTQLPNGIWRAHLSLVFGIPIANVVVPVSNIVCFYVR